MNCKGGKGCMKDFCCITQYYTVFVFLVVEISFINNYPIMYIYCIAVYKIVELLKDFSRTMKENTIKIRLEILRSWNMSLRLKLDHFIAF